MGGSSKKAPPPVQAPVIPEPEVIVEEPQEDTEA
jgi:hypothetical protein